MRQYIVYMTRIIALVGDQSLSEEEDNTRIFKEVDKIQDENPKYSVSLAQVDYPDMGEAKGWSKNLDFDGGEYE